MTKIYIQKRYRLRNLEETHVALVESIGRNNPWMLQTTVLLLKRKLYFGWLTNKDVFLIYIKLLFLKKTNLASNNFKKLNKTFLSQYKQHTWNLFFNCWSWSKINLWNGSADNLTQYFVDQYSRWSRWLNIDNTNLPIFHRNDDIWIDRVSYLS